MSHPYSSHKESSVAKRRAQSMKGGADNGVGRLNKIAMIHKADGGSVGGDDMSVPGYARGGRSKGKKGKGKGNHTKINIAILGGGKDKPDMGGNLPPMGMAPDMGPPPGPAAGLPPPGAMPGGPGGAPGGMPPGMPPKPPGPMGMMNRGGKVPMKGGADSGVGRLDKIKAYGSKAKKG